MGGVGSYKPKSPKGLLILTQDKQGKAFPSSQNPSWPSK